MAITVLTNTKSNGGKTTFIMTANNTVQMADLAGDGETVTAATITDITWSGNWTVARGANTLAVVTGNGDWKNVPLNVSPSANIVANCTGTGTLIVTVRKTSTGITTEY